MKKLFSIVVTVLLISVMGVSAFASAPESSNTATAVKIADNSITIDAVKDDIYDKGAHIILAEQNLDYFASSFEDSNGEAYIVFDNYYIYVYVDMYDEEIDYSNDNPQQTWNRESIGICFDFDYNRNVDYLYDYANGDHIAYVNLSGDGTLVTYHMYAVEELLGQIEFATVAQTEDNHILYEVACPIPDSSYGVNITAGQSVGFEICAPNAYGGMRNGCVSWSPDGSEMWHYTHVMGTLVMGEGAGAEAAVEETADEETVVEAVEETVEETAAETEVVEAVVETPAETDESVQTTTAPQTFDAFVLIACAAAISGAVIVTKKKNH